MAACTEEGKSYYLGPPAHMSIPQFISSVRVIQEPPKHLDYLPDDSCDPGKPCEWKIWNVSKLMARERKEVYVKWEIAKDLGGDEPDAGKPYVIYVTLDPDNEVQNEIHELYVAH